jgi:hypothetical protein
MTDIYYLSLVNTKIHRGYAMTAVKTLSVPVAGREYFELSRGAAYAAARRGLIPTIRIGGEIRVPVVALERMLESAGGRAEGSKLTAG